MATIRVESDLYEWLRERARRNLRSIAAELQMILTAARQVEGSSPKTRRSDP